jgi:hypothetical protein
MKSLYKYLAALLLVSYVVLSHFRPPQISDALVIGFLAGLVGYRMYLDKLEMPDIRAEVAEAFKNRDAQLSKIQNDMAQINVGSRVKELQNLRF